MAPFIPSVSPGLCCSHKGLLMGLLSALPTFFSPMSPRLQFLPLAEQSEDYSIQWLPPASAPPILLYHCAKGGSSGPSDLMKPSGPGRSHPTLHNLDDGVVSHGCTIRLTHTDTQIYMHTYRHTHRHRHTPPWRTGCLEMGRSCQRASLMTQPQGKKIVQSGSCTNTFRLCPSAYPVPA